VVAINCLSRSRIAHHLLENVEVCNITLSARSGYTSDRLWPTLVVLLGTLNHALSFEHLQVAREVAVRKATELLSIDEAEALRIRHQ
jgi:hypothetical protein